MFAHMPERGALQILVLSTSTIFCDLSIEFMIVLSAFFLHVIPRLFYLVRLREKSVITMLHNRLMSLSCKFD